MTESEIKSALRETCGNVQAAAELLASVKRSADGRNKPPQEPEYDPDLSPPPSPIQVLSLIPRNGLEPPTKRARTIEEYKEIAGNTPPDVILAVNAEESEPTQDVRDDALPSMHHMNTISEKFLSDDPDLLAKYRGHYTEQWGWLLWLQEKLPNDTLCVYTSKTDHEDYLLYIEIEKPDAQEVKKHMYISPDFYAQIKECRTKKTRFVIGILTLPSHSNALVFDFENKVISRFEPHGGGEKTLFPHAIVDSEILRHLILGKGLVGSPRLDPREKYEWEKTMFQGWTYNSPRDFCPVLGVQTKQVTSKLETPIEKTGGYCAAWAMIFMHQRVINPHKTEEQVVQYFLDKKPDDLLRLIRKYAAFMVSAAEDKLIYEQVYKQGDWVARWTFAVDTKSFIFTYGRVETYLKEKRMYGISVFDWSTNESGHKTGRFYVSPMYLKTVTDEKVLQTLENNYMDYIYIEIGNYAEYLIDGELQFAGEVLLRNKNDSVVLDVRRVYKKEYALGKQIAPLKHLKKRNFKMKDKVNWVTANGGIREDRGWGEIKKKMNNIYEVIIWETYESPYGDVTEDFRGKNDKAIVLFLNVLDLTTSTK